MKQAKFEEIVKKISDKDKIYISWGATGLSNKTIFFYNPYYKTRFNKVSLGWTTHSPHYYKILNYYSIENIYEDIVERDDIFIVCMDNEVEMFREFMLEHYDRQILAIFIDEIKFSGRSIFKIQDNGLKNN